MRVPRLLAGLLSPLLLSSAQAAALKQEPPAKRLSAIVGVAVDEYAKGVDATGRIISAVELDEATGFLKDARDVARRLSSPRADAVRLLLDSLSASAARRATPAQLAQLYLKFVDALGAEGALDLPGRPVEVARGKVLYDANCAQCHGPMGAGDGPAAKTIVPPPEPIGSGALMHGVTPALMYRVVSVGVAGTMMTSWAAKLSSDDRWAVIAYVISLRSSDADRRSGAALLRTRCPRCDGPGPPGARSFAWLAERSDSQIVAMMGVNDSAAGVDGRAATAEERYRMVAALRASPVVAPRSGPSPAVADATDPRATARRALRLVDDALTAVHEHRPTDAADLA